MLNLMGFRAKRDEDGGVATTQRNTQKNQEKAKREFPEAPTLIGMQDERGARGG